MRDAQYPHKFIVIQFLTLVLLIAALLSAGCVDLSTNVEVTSDGTLSQMSVAFKTSSSTYILLKDEIDESLSELRNRDFYRTYFVTDIKNDGRDFILTIRNIKPIPISEYDTMKFDSYDGKVTFRDFSEHGNDELYSMGGSITYTLKMPGTILDSNADEVEGDTAVWFFRNGETDIWATSKASTFSIPGFGIILSFIVIATVIAAVVGYFYRYSERKEETLIPLIIALIVISGIALLFMGGGSNDTTAITTPVNTPYPTTTPTITSAPTTSSSTETVSQINAVKKAKSYLSHSTFSRDGLISQLEYEKFPHVDAVYGVDNSGANWEEQAVKKAKSYLSHTAFSRDRLISQ